MIIFDASYLVVFLNKDPEPAMDRQGKPVARFKERVEYLAASLNASGEQIGIPTPAMAEVLVKAGNGRPQFVSILSDRMRFQLVSFDARAAIECAELIALIKSKNEKWATHAKVKFDIQIVATAKAEDASVIYSDDEDIERFAKRLKIPVLRICNLPTPPPKVFAPIEAVAVGGQTTMFSILNSEAQLGAPTEREESPVTGANAAEKVFEHDDAIIVDAPNPDHDSNASQAHLSAIQENTEGKTETTAIADEFAYPTAQMDLEKPKATIEGGLGESGS